MNQCAQCASQSDLRRCTGCLEVWYCSRECQKQHWRDHKITCGKNKSGAAQESGESSNRQDKESEKKNPPVKQTCANCESASGNLQQCASCLAVSYCCKACQISHWTHHKAACKKKTPVKKNEKSDLVKTGAGPKAYKGRWSRTTAGIYYCDNCNYCEAGHTFRVCPLCNWSSDKRGSIHPAVNVEQRKGEAVKRNVEAKRLADLWRENRRPTNQQDGAGVNVTLALTWEEARSRADRLYPGKMIVDKFKDLGDDRWFMPPYENVVSISRIKDTYPSDWHRVARYLEDYEGETAYMICYNEGRPEPYFRHDQLVEGNVFCIDHAHLHIFADQSVGFRVDYPWDVHIMEP